MKKIITCLLLAVITIGAKAQFESGTKYVSTSLTGLGISYSSSQKFCVGIDATAGYFITDGVMLKANIGYDHRPHIDDFNLGAGARYCFTQNGIYLGAGAEFSHITKNFNDVMIPVEVGYAFYLNHYVTIEPSVYYKMSVNNFSDNSTVGLKVGFGYYF